MIEALTYTNPDTGLLYIRPTVIVFGNIIVFLYFILKWLTWSTRS